MTFRDRHTAPSRSEGVLYEEERLCPCSSTTSTRSHQRRISSVVEPGTFCCFRVGVPLSHKTSESDSSSGPLISVGGENSCHQEPTCCLRTGFLPYDQPCRVSTEPSGRRQRCGA